MADGGYRGLLGYWGGGAGAPAPKSGVRSLLAFWAGGASGVAPIVSGKGYRSLLAFWMGGACGTGGVTPTADRDFYPGGGVYEGDETRKRLRRARRIRRDDGEMMDIMALWLGGVDA